MFIHPNSCVFFMKTAISSYLGVTETNCRVLSHDYEGQLLWPHAKVELSEIQNTGVWIQYLGQIRWWVKLIQPFENGDRLKFSNDSVSCIYVLKPITNKTQHFYIPCVFLKTIIKKWRKCISFGRNYTASNLCVQNMHITMEDISPCIYMLLFSQDVSRKRKRLF